MKNNAVRVVGFLAITSLVLLSYLPSAHALASVDFAIKELCGHMQGKLGGLLMAAAGVGGIASAAFGNMKAMYSCLVTAIGAFGVSTVLSLHFPTAAGQCNGGGTATARTKSEATISEAQVSKFNPESAAKSYISSYKNDETLSDSNSKTESDVTSAVKAEDEDSDLELF